MDIMVGGEKCGPEGLSEVLARVAMCPKRTDHLHEILGGYCHQTRNALNCVKMSLYLARKATPCQAQAVWNEVDRRYLQAERFIERLQSLCRPAALCPVRLPLHLLIDERRPCWENTLAAVDRPLVVEPPPEPVVGAFDPARLAMGLNELVAWRARSGDPNSALRVRWSAEGDRFRVAWDEPPRRDRSAAPPADPVLPCEGDFLAVPLLTRVMTDHSGCLHFEGGPEGPWTLVLRWPLDARSAPREAS